MDPYIVSADIKLLLARWAKERGFVLPGDEFFAKLRKDFSNSMSQIFPSFEFVTEEELVAGLTEFAKASTCPVVSIDKAYYPTSLSLDITRLCQTVENGVHSVEARHGQPPLAEQIRRIRETSDTVAILDDVVFEGKTLVRIIEALKHSGIRVTSVIAGIGISEGVSRIQDMGVGVRCVRRYTSAIDEVCERDFYPGVPYSGRSMAGDANIGIPYLLPDGKPEKWASIPKEWCRPFSRVCLQFTYALFERISELTDKPVLVSDLDRKIYGYLDDEQSVSQMLQFMEMRVDGVSDPARFLRHAWPVNS